MSNTSSLKPSVTDTAAVWPKTTMQPPWASQQPLHQGTVLQPPYQGTLQQPPYQGTFQQPPYQGTVQQPPYQETSQNPYSNVPSSGSDPLSHLVSRVPSSPPVEQMDRINGYEQVSFSAAPLAPPVQTTLQDAPPVRNTVQNIPVINEDVARDALLGFIDNHCCYGKGAAEEMVFKDIVSSSAFHYTLESFTEKREVKWKSEPYDGQMIDSSMNGPAPRPWDIPVKPAHQFKNSVVKMEVPHTASLKPCPICTGLGWQCCTMCLGDGKVHCLQCKGSGHVMKDHYDQHHDSHDHQEEVCITCGGTGKNRCTVCSGCAQVKCSKCSGLGQFKCYIELTVTWMDHLDDQIVERTALPDALIREVSGQVAFEEESPRVWPVTHFPDITITTTSKSLVHKHAQLCAVEKILMQRQRIRIVPVYQILYQWRQKDGDFYICGFENVVHFPDYPQKYCCGLCTIL